MHTIPFGFKPQYPSKQIFDWHSLAETQAAISAFLIIEHNPFWQVDPLSQLTTGDHSKHESES
jgi:hypothetical protein